MKNTETNPRCASCNDPQEALGACDSCRRGICDACMVRTPQGRYCPACKDKAPKAVATVETLISNGKLAKMLDLEAFEEPEDVEWDISPEAAAEERDGDRRVDEYRDEQLMGGR